MNRLIIGFLLPVVCEGISLAKFEFTPACFHDPGSTSQLLRDIQTAEACAQQCEKNNCQGIVYRFNMSDCYLLNAVPGDPFPNGGCEQRLMAIHGRPTTDDPLRPRRPHCLYGGGCTSSVKGLRLCDGGGPGICNPYQGRLEVFYKGEWGTVCDDSWTTSSYYNAEVTCRMLGYPSGTTHCCAYYGQGTGRIWMDDVRCNSPYIRKLEQCSRRAWGSHNCGHYEDSSVTCDPY